MSTSSAASMRHSRLHGILSQKNRHIDALFDAPSTLRSWTGRQRCAPFDRQGHSEEHRSISAAAPEIVAIPPTSGYSSNSSTRIWPSHLSGRYRTHNPRVEWRERPAAEAMRLDPSIRHERQQAPANVVKSEGVLAGARRLTNRAFDTLDELGDWMIGRRR